MTYREAVAWLYDLQLYGIKLGLENMRRLCTALEVSLGPSLPERNSSGERPAVFIHVAGTNGKGSVCAMLAAICRAGGVRCGLYTSPHLVTFRERIQLDGAMISEADVAAGLTRIRDLVRDWVLPPTFFEVTTALALEWFQDQHAAVVILETGLGGRLDATNVVTPAVSVLTPIALDHQQILGPTLVQIASEKCGIIKDSVPVVSAPQQEEVAAVILATAQRTGSSCKWVTKPWAADVGLAGEHQRWNAALAALALDAAATNHPSLNVEFPSVARALSATQWPGRFQRVGDRVILDGAHNPSAMATLAATWRAEYGDDRATVIFGMMRDKDVRAVILEATTIAARIFTVPVQNARATAATDLADLVHALVPGLSVTDFPTLTAALQAGSLEAERSLVTGSLFLVGEALVELGVVDAAGERSDQ